MKVNIQEAKIRLSRLLADVARGEEVIIARAGRPVARLVPVAVEGERILGQDRGLVEVPEDFDDPLPEEMLAEFGS